MSFELDPVQGPRRLATFHDAKEDEWRFAGDQLALQLNSYEGIPNKSLDDLRRLRSDKYIPRSFGSEYGTTPLSVIPENSEPGYFESGAYQPSVAYGA